MKKRRRKKKVVEVDMDELRGIVDSSASGPLSEDQRNKLLSTLELLAEQIDPAFRNSEKLNKLVEEMLRSSSSETSDKGKDKAQGGDDKKRKGGNGRTPAAQIKGAEVISCPHQKLNRGDPCPECEKGKVYPKAPEVIVRFKGSPLVQATKYELGKFRCNLCGQTFTADPPEGIGKDKYDESVASILGLLIYGGGLPRNRLAGLQKMLGIPLPQSTQWEILDKAAEKLEPILKELIRQAAQGEVLHSDDTSRKILNLDRPEDDTRTGVFTSGIISTPGIGNEAPKIALFFTGSQHAGENLRDVLKHRESELDAPIAMHDAESKNASKIKSDNLEAELANCLPHGRRYFVDNFKNFPEQCHHVLTELCKVFKNEKQAKEEKMSPAERLAFHQTHSGPVMEELRVWMESELREKRAEPNGGLGKSIKYMLNHWDKLTLFLRKAGAPVDNNLAERGLKKSILHRKNSLFFRNQRGADVGDLYTSIIHTCELNEANPFDYFKTLLANPKAIEDNPADWMPWTYEAAASNQGK